jgi:metallo-beta-lactamase class B
MKWCSLLLILGLPLPAQNANAVGEHVDAAKKIGGADWAAAAGYFCSESAVANRPTDPAIEPTQLFDNIYAIGSVGTAVYVIRTSEGLILIDAGYPDQIESVLLAGMKKLSLDPAQVRYVIVTHGHSDHFGAARYFQDTYSSKVYLSRADWDLLSEPAAAKGKGPSAPAPQRDQVVVDRQPIRLGDTEITPILVPGHTPAHPTCANTSIRSPFTEISHGSARSTLNCRITH